MLRSTRFLSAVAITKAGTLLNDPSDIIKHITVSDAAWSRLAYINKRDNQPDRWLRLQIVPGGCRGFTYEFLLANAKADSTAANASRVTSTTKAERFDDDVEFVNDACVPSSVDELSKNNDATDDAAAAATDDAAKSTQRFLIDGVSLTKLKDAKVEFVSNLSGMGFYVDGNSNVDKSCACKLSFSMKEDEE